MTEQEIIETVCTALDKQGARSLNTKGECVYRGAGGLKCAVGVLIPDGEYCESLEGELTMDLLDATGLDESHLDLLLELQNVHDGVWSPALESFSAAWLRYKREEALQSD